MLETIREYAAERLAERRFSCNQLQEIIGLVIGVAGSANDWKL
jgi:hypothetical protein